MHIKADNLASEILSRTGEPTKACACDSHALQQLALYVHIKLCDLTTEMGILSPIGARCRSAVRAFAHGAMVRRIDPSWGGPIELFLVPASAPRLLCAILSVGWCI